MKRIDRLLRQRNSISNTLSVTRQEQLAVSITVFLFLFIPIGIWSYEGEHRTESRPAEAKVFTLTGVGTEGIWTLEEVAGYNYWWRSFPKSTVVVQKGDFVVLRLKSADVTHVFYAPTLGLGPITVEPGHVREVTFRANIPGAHEFYCLSVCGDCHFFMRGQIVVGSENPTSIPSHQPAHLCAHDLREPAKPSLYEWGQYLFTKVGCISCHGEKGGGSVVNPNYVKGTVPPLDKLGRTLSLADQEAADELMTLIEQGKSLEEIADIETNIPRQSLVMAKYAIVRDVIHKGRPAARADTTSFEPPLSMPSWEQKLSERDIDAIIVYLLRQESWELEKE